LLLEKFVYDCVAKLFSGIPHFGVKLQMRFWIFVHDGLMTILNFFFPLSNLLRPKEKQIKSTCMRDCEGIVIAQQRKKVI